MVSSENDCCAICLESFESYHTIARPNECNHPFHVSCIRIWMTYNKTCPCCRREITVESQLQWGAILAVTIALTREHTIQRSLCALAFLDHLLKKYVNAKQFNDNYSRILNAIEHLQITNIRLPFLTIRTRADAIREKKKWKTVAEELLEDHVQRIRLIPFQESIAQWI